MQATDYTRVHARGDSRPVVPERHSPLRRLWRSVRAVGPQRVRAPAARADAAVRGVPASARGAGRRGAGAVPTMVARGVRAVARRTPRDRGRAGVATGPVGR